MFTIYRRAFRAEQLYHICDSPSLEIGEAQLRSSFEEITVLTCINRSRIRYDFRAGAKTIGYVIKRSL